MIACQVNENENEKLTINKFEYIYLRLHVAFHFQLTN